MDTCLHFSHHHQLVRTNSPTPRNIACSGCKLNILSGKDYYFCKSCPCYLHQVCFNMPRKTRHPGHFNHYLTLLVMPSSAKTTFNCKACGNHITGFYYNCAQCEIYYHILCSALPLSVAITSHPHALKLEFSPPYDFQCDLCNKPCYNSWLYRCRLCEFDTHLACAISNQKTLGLQHQSVKRQIKHSKDHSLMDTNRKIDYGSEGDELMQLVAEVAARGIKKDISQEIVQTAVAGWDERLRSPKGKHESSHPVSGELSTTTSYQFSDACFSIDLAKSYSSYDHHTSQGSMETSYHGKIVFPRVKEETISYRNNVMLDRISNNLEPSKQEFYHANLPGFDHFHSMGTENRLNEAFLVEGATHTSEELLQKEKKKKAIESRPWPSIQDQSATSDTDGLGCSCWWKLF